MAAAAAAVARPGLGLRACCGGSGGLRPQQWVPDTFPLLTGEPRRNRIEACGMRGGETWLRGGRQDAGGRAKPQSHSGPGHGRKDTRGRAESVFLGGLGRAGPRAWEGVARPEWRVGWGLGSEGGVRLAFKGGSGPGK